MKIILASILAAVPAAAFTPSMPRPVVSTSLSAVGAAKSAEEDRELTLKVIMDSLVDDGSGIDDSDDDTPYEAPAAAAGGSSSRTWPGASLLRRLASPTGPRANMARSGNSSSP